MTKQNEKDAKRVPELRFKGFTDDWEQRKLGKITDVRDGTHDSPHYVDEGYPLITSKNVSNGRINYDAVNYVSEYDFNQINKRSKVNINDILMGMIGTIGNLALIREDPNFAIKNVALIKYTESINHQFLFQNLQTSYISKELSNSMDGGTQKFISLKKIRNLSINLPKLKEQEKIGQLFQYLDKTITLHEEKQHQLERLKKALLQKMLPKNGAKVPELRFAGFADDWEERKLNENVENIGTGRSSFKAGLDYSEQTPYEVLGSTSVISYSDSFDHSGNFVLTARVGANAGNLYKHSGNVKISDNTVYIQSKNLEFIFYLLTKYDLKKLAFGTGQPLIKASELKNLKLFFPKKIGEQQKIGSFFKQLDDTIALHQRKLDLLKEQKKGFLQKMFV